MTSRIRTTAVFPQPFEITSFDEELPAGDYEIETEFIDPVDWIEPGNWKASVLVHLKPWTSRPDLSRNLTLPLTEMEGVVGKDKLSGKVLIDYFLEEMLDDPLIWYCQRNGVRPPLPALYLKWRTQNSVL